MTCIHRRKQHAAVSGITVWNCAQRQLCTETDHGRKLMDGSPMPVCATCPLFVSNQVPPAEPPNPNGRQQPKLTIGIPYFRDWPGLWATIQSIRLNHREVEPETEIIVIDNDPQGEPDRLDENNHSNKAKRLCSAIGARYEHYAAIAGTAAAKGRIFDLATAPAVLVIDCHVLLPSLTIANLINFFDDNYTKDLYQGPCIGDGGIDDIIGTHFAPKWGNLMYGQWATDERIYPTVRPGTHVRRGSPDPAETRHVRRGSPDPAETPDRRSQILPPATTYPAPFRNPNARMRPVRLPQISIPRFPPITKRFRPGRTPPASTNPPSGRQMLVSPLVKMVPPFRQPRRSHSARSAPGRTPARSPDHISRHRINARQPHAT